MQTCLQGLMSPLEDITPHKGAGRGTVAMDSDMVMPQGGINGVTSYGFR